MTYPRGPWRQGGINAILMWLSVGVVTLWLGRALIGGEGVRRFPRVDHGHILSGGSLFVLAVSLALGGVLLWKGLTFFFWRKYFPTQDPTLPPGENKDPFNDHTDRRNR